MKEREREREREHPLVAFSSLTGTKGDRHAIWLAAVVQERTEEEASLRMKDASSSYTFLAWNETPS